MQTFRSAFSTFDQMWNLLTQCINLLILCMVLNVLNIRTVTEALTSHELCSSKVCSGCIAGSLSCQEGGLTRLPDQLAPDIQSMILTGHRFQNTVLLKRNFSNYPLQTKQLQRLTLRNCGIERLEPGALHPLKTLQQLDLSQNRIHTIEYGTFSGLQLDFLRLDENVQLRLLPGAFWDASIVSLSMNQCGLKFLSFDDLAPLFANNVLKNLHISGNKLFTLEDRFEPSFLNLQSLSLEQNPFVCDCKLSWLADVLRRRTLLPQSRTLRKSRDESGQRYSDENSSDLVSDFKLRPNNAPLDGDLLKPACRMPERLAGRPLEALVGNDFYCNLPQLRALEIDISQLEENISTLSSTKTDDGLIEAKVNALAVTLRCQVEGSPEMQLSWYRHSGHSNRDMVSQLGIPFKPELLTAISTSKTIKPGVAEVQVSHPGSSSEGGRKMNIVAEIDRLVCFASDLSGNTTAEVKLQWPIVGKLSGQPPKIGGDGDPYLLAETMRTAEEKSIKPSAPSNPEDMEPDHRSDWYILTGEDPNGFWLQKQFSALQMIGAVVGTFTITLALFIVGCCLLKAQQMHRHCRRSKILLQQTSYQNTSSGTKYSAHSSYPAAVAATETQRPIPYSSVLSSGVESDMQNSFRGQLTYQFPPANQVMENGTVASEIAGAKRLPFQTYDLNSMSETQTPTSYSDSQTYDIPQFPQFFSPPTAPLPPLPVVSTSVATSHTVDARTPFLISNLSCPLSESVGPTNASLLPSLLVNNTENMSAAMSMAATLNRLQKQCPVPLNANESATQQQLAFAHGQLFNFINQPSIHVQQTVDNS